jgi:predicted AAA+ superfamily ATPase
MSRLSSIGRALHIDVAGTRAIYLVGARKCGKTTLLHRLFPHALWLDLLHTDLRTELTLSPSLLRQRVLHEKPRVVVIDEIQKVPALVDEIHWCIENTPSKFVMCSSSARSLKRDLAGFLGGRAWRYELFPFTLHEVGIPPLEQVVASGLIPPHFFSTHPERDLKAYVYDYLEEEIRRESKVRDLPAFARFLETAALMNGELLNFANVAREAGVSPKTVRGYYDILEETLLCLRLQPWRKVNDRRLIETAKVYLFDVGVMRYLKRIPAPARATPDFGNAFETLMIHEVSAYRSYQQKNVDLSFWRTASSFEVDLLIGSLRRIDVAFEFKSSAEIRSTHLKGLRAFAQEHPGVRRVVVCLARHAQTTEDGIEIFPYAHFVRSLWKGEFF